MSGCVQQIPLFAHLAEASAAALTPAAPRQPRPRKDLLRVCVLGSGSGGNCTVLACGSRILLIDAGFGPRTTGRKLAQAGLDLDQVQAVCLTHLDQDHFRRNWPAELLKRELRVYLHHWHVDHLFRLPGGHALFEAGLVECFDGEPFEPVNGIITSTCRCQHDMQGTISYRFDTDSGCVGFATDLGHVPAALIDHLAGVDLLAIECNYDEHMTIHSPRPSFVNRRNMSSSGHLSNDQSFAAVQQISAASVGGNPRQVVLLHRSSQCNHPMKVKRVFEQDARLAARITLTEQRRRTRWLHVKPQPVRLRAQMHWGF